MRDEVAAKHAQGLAQQLEGALGQLASGSGAAAATLAGRLRSGAEALTETGGIWRAIFELWVAFGICVAILLILSQATRLVTGPPAYISDEEKAREQLLEALAKAETLSKDIETTKRRLSDVAAGSPLGAAAAAAVAKGEPVWTPERTSPRSTPRAAAEPPQPRGPPAPPEPRESPAPAPREAPRPERVRVQEPAEEDEELDLRGECEDQFCELPVMAVRRVDKALARTSTGLGVAEDVEELEELRAPWTVEALRRILGDMKVPLSTWPKFGLETFTEELKTGQARLRTRAGRPTRDVDLLMLVVEHKDYILQEKVDSRGDEGHFPPLPEKVVATRLMVDEDMFTARKRLLRKAGIPESAVHLHDSLIDVTDTVENMDIFPGLGSVVRKFLVRAEVTATDPAVLRKMGFPDGSVVVKGKNSTKTFKWAKKESAIAMLKYFSRANAANKRVHRKRGGAAHGSMRRTVDNSSEVLLPWTAEALTKLFEEYNVKSSIQEYGHPVDHLVTELNEGISYLTLTRSEPRTLLLVRDIVSLFLDDDGSAVVLEGQDGGRETVAELPCELCFADESQIAAARRAAKIELGLHAVDLLIVDAPTEQANVTAEHYKAYDVQAWSDSERPRGRRLRHFVVHGKVKPGACAMTRDTS